MAICFPCRLTFNSVLWVNRDACLRQVDPDTDMSTWEQVGDVLDQLKAGGEECPLVTAWQSRIHLENFSAYHDVAGKQRQWFCRS